jgi:uncharacterized membrane protein
MKRIFNYFLNGLILSAPVALTVYVCWRVFSAIDGWLNLSIPGVGFVVTIAVITLIGFVASNFLAKRALALIEELLNRVPGVRLLYTAIRDVMGAFVGEKKRFSQPVLVTLDVTAGTKALGFLTQETVDELGIADHVSVYLPQSYNFAGQTLLVPRDRITHLTAPSARVMAFVVSGGVADAGRERAESGGVEE